jgi:hypothetical protein
VRVRGNRCSIFVVLKGFSPCCLNRLDYELQVLLGGHVRTLVDCSCRASSLMLRIAAPRHLVGGPISLQFYTLSISRFIARAA